MLLSIHSRTSTPTPLRQLPHQLQKPRGAQAGLKRPLTTFMHLPAQLAQGETRYGEQRVQTTQRKDQSIL